MDFRLLIRISELLLENYLYLWWWVFGFVFRGVFVCVGVFVVCGGVLWCFFACVFLFLLGFFLVSG